MSGLDIEAIRERSLLAERLPSGLRQHAGRNVAALSDSAADVPALLAEVERLTTEARNAEFENVQLRGALAAARTASDLYGEERDEARAALADALQVIADLRGETP